MDLKEVARKTLEIIELGRYTSSSGERIEIGPEIQEAVAGTIMLRPPELERLLAESSPTPSEDAAAPPSIEVTGETTQLAAQRLVLEEGASDLVLLNFASARNPGGGFLGGARAQEEDLARCSALHACLSIEAVKPYYRDNRVQSSMLYTDHMIWSPKVPFFRTNSGNIIDEPFCASVITAPAPNAAPFLTRGGKRRKLEKTLRQRAGMVLALAQRQGHRALLLGAWGCGVFRNQPHTVADAFGAWLEHKRFAGAFDRVTFAILDPKGTTRAAFNSRFPRPGLGD